MKKVLITGGTGSVGRSLVSSFSSAGFEVIFQYQANKALAESLSESFGATPICCNLSKEEECIRLAANECDILVNNAAVNTCREAAAEVPMSDWQITLAINLTAPFLLSRSALKNMVAKGWGRIINISSIYGLRGSERNLSYTVSKHGLSGLTKTIAREYAKAGVTCNEICPGPIDSDLLSRIAQYYRERGGADVSEYIRNIAAEIPAQRLAAPVDIAACAVFLASDAASYINGVSIPIDGALIS